MISFKQYLLNERLGPAAIRAKNMGLEYYGFGRWGKDRTVEYKQIGTSVLKKVDAKHIEAPHQPIMGHALQRKIRKSRRWKLLGSGQQSSVWSLGDDTQYVYKISGAGSTTNALFLKEEQCVDLAFLHFLMNVENDHLPVILDVNTNNIDLIQIKMEKLKPIDPELGDALWDLMIDVTDGGIVKDVRKDYIDQILKATGLTEKNSVDDLISVIKLLHLNMATYISMYTKNNNRSKTGYMDLHSGNWMVRSDGTIVASDPWY